MNSKKHTPAFLLISLMVCVTIFMSGCTDTRDQITSLTDIMQITPENYSLVSYADISTISKDSVLSAGFGDDIVHSIPALSQVDIGKITTMGWYASSDPSQYRMATVIGGELDPSVIQKSLTDAGYVMESYHGENLFYYPDYNDAVLIKDSYIVTGSREAVAETMDVLAGRKQSAYSADPSMNTLAKNLPGGFLSVVMTGNAVSFLEMDGMATDMKLSPDGTVLGTVIIMVNDETVLSQLHDDLTSRYDSVLSSMPQVFEDADITISENMIIFSGIIPAESLFSDDTYTSLFS
ncbi:MAG: hypothetical protein JXA44_09465 [Methanospirillaceae archaeon]|nr:hypothetical protein [Methanospirillaceae archaeon]